MPNRIIREGILTSDRVDQLGWAEEVFYRRLQSVVDDHGRFHANPKLIRAACFPLRVDKVSDADIGKWTASCSKAGLVSVYPASDGKRYLQIINFGQRVQSKSKFPDPFEPVTNGDPPLTTVENRLVVGVVEDVGGDVPQPRKRGAHKKPIPDGFSVSARVKAWANGKDYGNLDAHLEAFRSKAKAKGYQYVDWDEAFMGAIREDWAKVRNGHAVETASPASLRRLA